MVSSSIEKVQPIRPAKSTAAKIPIFQPLRLYTPSNAEYRRIKSARILALCPHLEKIGPFRGVAPK
jgi:hypothetical protein